MVAPVAAQEEKAKEDKSTKDAKDDKKKTKGEKKDEMTEEDKKLEEDLNMLVQRLSENDASLYQPSLETMRTLIRASTTSMTSVPKPLKFMRPHYNQMKQIFEKMEPGPTKTLCADIISVLAMCSDEKSDCINFRMKVSFSNSQLARIDPELARQAGESTLAYLTRVRQKMPSLPVPLIQRIAFMHEAARYRSQKFELKDLMELRSLLNKFVKISFSLQCYPHYVPCASSVNGVALPDICQFAAFPVIDASSVRPSVQQLCLQSGCRLRGVAPKRSNLTRRASLHLVRLLPQLRLILSNTIDHIIEIHSRLHTNNWEDSRILAETYDFDMSERLESNEQFERHELKILLTISTDGVVFTRLSKSQAWPLYVRIENLSHHEKNLSENILLPGVLFTPRTPSRVMLEQLLFRTWEELRTLRDGLKIADRSGTVWNLVPTIEYGIADFSALHILFKSPAWNSNYGCHMCTFPGLRFENRLVWYNANPTMAMRRTRTSILRDASANLQGLRERTKLMNLLSMDSFRPDALHLLSEGVSSDLFREIFQSDAKTTVIPIKRSCVQAVALVLEKIPNATYASKFILGMENLPRMTGAEKDALMFVLFPLIAAENLCSKPVGSACIVVYWLTVRYLADIESFTVGRIGAVRMLALAMKTLWGIVSKKLFTLKLHCFLDHCILEDLSHYGSPYLWSAAPFERLHQQLQARVVQKKTNCEKAFLLHKELTRLSSEQAKRSDNPLFLRLHSKVLRDCNNRFPVSVRLQNEWFVPVGSDLHFTNLQPEHQSLLASFKEYFFCSRLCNGQSVYNSSVYWTRPSGTKQHCVCLDVNDSLIFGNVLVFAYQSVKECYVLLEVFEKNDPFCNLDDALHNDDHPGKLAAIKALDLTQLLNKYFFVLNSKHVQIHDAYDIKYLATIFEFNKKTYISRL